MERQVNRRDFIKTAAGATAALVLTSGPNLFAEKPKADAQSEFKKITMVDLPYGMGALAPSISERTVNLHYNKHHKGYFTYLTGWINAHPEYQGHTLEELILKNEGGIQLDEAVFQYAVMLYNHNWYWQSLRPAGGGVPKGKIEKMITASYGSFNTFHKTVLDEAMKFGIGWVWIVQDGEAVKVYRSEYIDTPLLKGFKPLLAIDVWEHAYYIDYENDRQKYVEAVMANLINWNFAEANLVTK
ncbi:MAG: Fe-Mn family superoxide dismutase [Chitinivibrionales bacterium]